MKRESVVNLIEWLYNILADIHFEGHEQIPTEGGIIITCNHLSRLDIPLLGLIPNRRDVIPLVADKYQSNSAFRWFVSSINGIWIDRSKADFTAFKTAIEVVKGGKSIGIAPEGTRSTTGQLLEGKSGTVLLAIKTRVPIVPVGIFGTENGARGMLRLQRPRVTARFGPPYLLPAYDRSDKDNYMKRCTEEIMCRIAALLPEKYHGFYSEHPRVKEIVRDTIRQPV